MCGIAGFTGFSANRDQARGVLSEMLERLRHRGPEGTGQLIRANAALGHTMLGFVQVGNNPQPLASASGRYALSFNGEIYNRKELEEEIASRGILSSPSDTELLLRAWEVHGLDLARRLRGMFAIAIQDFETGAVYLLRDPFGKKPLFYFVTPGTVAYASELTALLVHPECPSGLDETEIARYFLFHSVPAPGTLLHGVRQVPAGSTVTAKPGFFTETRYWNVPAPNESTSGDAREWETQLDAALTTAVRRRLESSDVPLGTFLSGGVDSSLVTSIAQEISDKPLPAFSAGFEDASYDETPYAAEVATRCGCGHYPVRLSRRDLAEVVIGEYPRLDVPIADPSLAPGLLLARHARGFVKGVLSGDGADEIFLGYRFFQAVKLLTAMETIVPAPLLDAVRRGIEQAPVRHTNLSLGFLWKLLARGFGTPPERRWYESTGGFASKELPAIFADSGAWRPREQLYQPLEDFLTTLERPPKGPMARAQLGMICHYLRDVILQKIDRAAMRNSLEVRSPFLDIDLIELGMAIPERARMRGFETKHILKRLALRRLPAAIVHRKKQGFRMPVAALLCAELREFAGDLLAPSLLARDGWFRADFVRRLWEEHLEKKRDHSKPLWSLVCFQAWRHGAYLARPVAAMVRDAKEVVAR